MKIALIHTVKPLVSTFELKFRSILPVYLKEHDCEYSSSYIESLEVVNILDEYLAQYLTEHPWDAGHRERLIQVARLAEESGADLMMFTCSSLSIEVNKLRDAGVFRIASYTIDEAMLRGALQSANLQPTPHITVVATAESTLGPTREHLESLKESLYSSTTIDMKIVPHAYVAMRQGDKKLHDTYIIDFLLDLDDPGVVVLAQASMAHISQEVQNKVDFPIYDSVTSAFHTLAKYIMEEK